MKLIPAIDLLNGKAVRLVQGDYKQVNIYSEDPVGMAREFEEAGATMLHLVDLDAAKDTQDSNLDTIVKIRNAISIPIELGGGIRSHTKIKAMIDIGIERLILGTIAVEDPTFVNQAIKEIGRDSVVIGIDAKDGMVKVNGWLGESGFHYRELFHSMISNGAVHFIFTDISKDGMMQGPNLEAYKEILSLYPNIHLVASGGVSSLVDLEKLSKISGLFGAVCGKALYEGHIDLKSAIELLQRGI